MASHVEFRISLLKFKKRRIKRLSLLYRKAYFRFLSLLHKAAALPDCGRRGRFLSLIVSASVRIPRTGALLSAIYLFQRPLKLEGKQDRRKTDRKKIRDWFRQIDRCRLVGRKDLRQQEDQRQQKDKFAHYCNNNRGRRIA